MTPSTPTTRILALAASCVVGCSAYGGTQFEQFCTGAPTAVPDPGSMQFDIDFGVQPGSVESLTLDVQIDTEWVGDLTIELTHNGTSVVVMDQVAWETHPFGCGGDDIDCRFTDTSAVTPESLCDNATVPMLTSEIGSQESLSAFAGADPSGIWSVTVTDTNAYDTATVVSICLNLALTPPPPCDGDANGDNVVDVNDISYVLFRLGGAPPDGDANGDGSIDVNDISYVLFRLGDC